MPNKAGTKRNGKSAKASHGQGAHFRPVPLQPPKTGEYIGDYCAYIHAYRLYEAELNTRRQDFWERANALSRGLPSSRPTLSSDISLGPPRIAVELSDGSAVPSVFSSMNAAEAFVSRNPHKSMTIHQQARAEEYKFEYSDESPPSRSPAPSSSVSNEGKKERRRAARKRQRAAKALRNSESEKAKTRTQTALVVAQTELAQARIGLVKSTNAWNKWTLVENKRSKSRIPVPGKSNGPSTVKASDSDSPSSASGGASVLVDGASSATSRSVSHPTPSGKIAMDVPVAAKAPEVKQSASLVAKSSKKKKKSG